MCALAPKIWRFSLSDIRILIVDDTPLNIDILRAALTNIDSQIIVATDGERALKLAQKSPPDLILLDVMMPGLDGFEVCQRLKSNSKTEAIPVMFVTACTDDVSKGFSVGGCDYISKPINTDEVFARVNHQLEKQRLLTQLQNLNAKLESKVKQRTASLAISNRQLREEIRERRYMQDRMQYLASHDFTTHLYNRIALEERATTAIASMQTESESHVLLLVDIDQFRLVNESCGCNAGDELLRQFADLVSGLCKDSVMFSRVGGDKFALLCLNSTKEKALGFAKVIHSTLDCFEFTWDKRLFELAATIALVEITSDIINFDQLMLRADEVMYLAKREGRNSTRAYEVNLSNSPGARQQNINWGIKLVDALKKDLFQLHFQRLQCLKKENDNTLDGYKLKAEILIRLWDPESKKLIFPDDFIPAAERLNIIPHIDRWVITHVINFLSHNRDKLNSIHNIAINLSALSIRDLNLADFIICSLENNNIPAHLLCFEITETESITSINSARSFLARLRKAGCSLALDDFGSGFSSFNYLRELPFDIVKIDGVFIKDMDHNESHRSMVKSIVDISNQMGKKVVAEYVETEAIEERVKELGIDWGQGYYYSKPIELTYDSLSQAISICKQKTNTA